MGADVNKPDGQFRLKPAVPAILAFLRDLPTRKVPGLGRVCEKICERVLGASTCGQLLDRAAEAHCLFSRARSASLLESALGWSNEERGAASAAAQKGISFSDTFKASDDPEELRRMLRVMCEGLSKSMEAGGLKGTKLTLRLKDSQFEVKKLACVLLAFDHSRSPLGFL